MWNCWLRNYRLNLSSSEHLIWWTWEIIQETQLETLLVGLRKRKHRKCTFWVKGQGVSADVLLAKGAKMNLLALLILNLVSKHDAKVWARPKSHIWYINHGWFNRFNRRNLRNCLGVTISCNTKETSLKTKPLYLILLIKSNLFHSIPFIILAMLLIPQLVQS